MSDTRQEQIAQLSNHVMMNMTLEEMMDFIYNSLLETMNSYTDEQLEELTTMVEATEN